MRWCQELYPQGPNVALGPKCEVASRSPEARSYLNTRHLPAPIRWQLRASRRRRVTLFEREDTLPIVLHARGDQKLSQLRFGQETMNSINTRVVKNRDRRRRNRPPTASG